MQALLSGQLESTPQLQAHLNRCLGCRACERACPSAVKYSKLIDGVRAIGYQQGDNMGQWARKIALKLASKPTLLSMGIRFLQCLPRHYLQKVCGQNLQRLIAFSFNLSRLIAWQTTYSPMGEKVGRVALFLGCMSQLSDQAALLSAIRLLNRLGWEVVVPPKQGCCGALYQHAGDPISAHEFQAQNRTAFAGQSVTAVLTIASGCGAHLKEYGDLSVAIYDVSDFLNRQPWPLQVKLKSLPQPVMVHDACSLRTADAVYPLLRQIPDITLIPLPENTLCCGAGGINLVTEPQIADALLAPKLTALRASKATILLSSNTSCALHFAAGIRKAGLNIEVLHPIQLLERQLLDNDHPTG